MEGLNAPPIPTEVFLFLLYQIFRLLSVIKKEKNAQIFVNLEHFFRSFSVLGTAAPYLFPNPAVFDSKYASCRQLSRRFFLAAGNQHLPRLNPVQYKILAALIQFA